MKYCFIVNPNSGNGSGLEVWNRTEALLKQKEVDYVLFLTAGPMDAWKKAAELTADMKEETAVIAIGGDGTIDEVLNGIYTEAPVIFGFIPSGSGNDLGRSLGLNIGTEAVVEKIIDAPEIIDMDFGELSFPDGTTRRFAVSCGIGFDAAVCDSIEKSSLKKFFNRLKMGKAVYTAIGLGEYIKARPYSGTVTVDGNREEKLENIFFLSFQNHPYEGGGYHFAPEARWGDGWLDMTAICSMNRIKLFPVLINKQNGTRENAFIHFEKFRELSVCMDQPAMMHSDGEVLGKQKEFRIRCVHGQLRVFA